MPSKFITPIVLLIFLSSCSGNDDLSTLFTVQPDQHFVTVQDTTLTVNRFFMD